MSTQLEHTRAHSNINNRNFAIEQITAITSWVGHLITDIVLVKTYTFISSYRGAILNKTLWRTNQVMQDSLLVTFFDICRYSEWAAVKFDSPIEFLKSTLFRKTLF